MNIVSFETIATEEKASTTEYYLWLLSQKFVWTNRHLQTWPAEDGPVKVVISKNDQSVVSYLASFGKMKNTSGFIFPSLVRDNALIKASTDEHKALLQKMANSLNDKISSYFGSAPILTRAGVVEGVLENNSTLGLNVRFADVAVKENASSSLQYLIGKTEKTITELMVSSDTAPLLVPNSSGTMATFLSKDFTALFDRNATSSLRKKPYWFDIQDGRILKISPLN
jgi:hypothetical protein